MTTPFQSSPDGAVTIGGGDWKYGQAVNVDTAKASFEFPQPTHDNMVDLLRMVLSQLPVDALKPFAGFLGMVDGVFDNIEDGVNSIIDSLGLRPVVHTLVEFEQWVHDFFDAIGASIAGGDLGIFTTWWHDNVTQPIADTIAGLGDVSVDLGTEIARAGAHIDGFIRGILGLIDSGFNVNIVEETAANLAASIAGMSAIITKLQSEESNGTFSGNAASVDFSVLADSATSIGAGWTQTYAGGSGTGTWGIWGGRTAWSGTATNRGFTAQYTAKVAKTDYQKVGAAFATAPSINTFGGNRSINSIYARGNASFTTRVYVDLYKNYLELGCYVSGSKTVFATDSTFQFKPGAAYWLECGTTGGLRVFRVWENSKIIKTYTDAAAVSAVGNYYTGLGGVCSTDFYHPAKISMFAFYDNTPQAVLGCGWRVARTNTTGGGWSTGTNLFPASWFDTIDYLTDDLTYTMSANKVKVPYAGWYQVNIHQHGNSGMGVGGGNARVALYRNGTPVQYGSRVAHNSSVGFVGMGGTFTVYCDANDELQPGTDATYSVSSAANADAGGLSTYWSGTFVGNKKPS